MILYLQRGTRVIELTPKGLLLIFVKMDYVIRHFQQSFTKSGTSKMFTTVWNFELLNTLEETHHMSESAVQWANKKNSVKELRRAPEWNDDPTSKWNQLTKCSQKHKCCDHQWFPVNFCHNIWIAIKSTTTSCTVIWLLQRRLFHCYKCGNDRDNGYFQSGSRN